MSVILILLFIVLPILEILAIIQVGSLVGPWWTVLLLVGLSVLGGWLLRVQGRRAWAEFRTALAEGRWPGDEVAQGALIIVGGTLLLTPGFITDLVGLLFLLGPTRRLVAGRVRRHVAQGTATAGAAAGGPGGGQHDPAGMFGGVGGARDAGHPGRGARQGPRTGAARDVELDVEVVEVRREQEPPAVDDPGGDDPRGDDPSGDAEHGGR